MGLDYVAGGGKSERGAPVFDTEIGLHEEREGKWRCLKTRQRGILGELETGG